MRRPTKQHTAQDKLEHVHPPDEVPQVKADASAAREKLRRMVASLMPFDVKNYCVCFRVHRWEMQCRGLLWVRWGGVVVRYVSAAGQVLADKNPIITPIAREDLAANTTENSARRVHQLMAEWPITSSHEGWGLRHSV